MTYAETVTWLFSRLPMYQRIGAAAYKADLGNTLALCNLLGNPQNSFKSIHVAGTNGKGSVSHMLASIFQEHGLKTGLHTSPHLKDFRERIRINGKMIPKRDVTSFVNRYRRDFETIRPSFFEMAVVMAFDHFRKAAVDVAVIEVGLGGRLDSTNVITPELSVITNISYDHVQFLGDTLEKIAREKAGIIKPGVPVLIGERHHETEEVFRESAKKQESPIFFADRDILELPVVDCPLKGIYQQKNLRTVLAAVEILNRNGYGISLSSVRKGVENVISNTGLAGRWQILHKNPLIICDTGHNQAGISMVLDQIKHTPHRHLHVVFGMVDDKDITSILNLLPETASYYFCKADIPRGLDASVLQKQARDSGLNGNAYPSVRNALTAAKKAARPEDLIFIGGSTFVVAEIL